MRQGLCARLSRKLVLGFAVREISLGCFHSIMLIVKLSIEPRERVTEYFQGQNGSLVEQTDNGPRSELFTDISGMRIQHQCCQ